MRLLSIFLALLVACFTGCKQPTACLTTERTTVSIMDTLTIQNCSTDADRYIWHTDGATRVEKVAVNNCSDSIVIYYQSPGVYTVTLEAGIYDGPPANCIVPTLRKSDKASLIITVN
ncbi:MAG: hypothetical protein KatS3mg031_0241 [Chitinophagales bacterium]|nr:MAG: hypothetical protein KatS3mg031_0241 [Chitinophagales bacterium]